MHDRHASAPSAASPPPPLLSWCSRPGPIPLLADIDRQPAPWPLLCTSAARALEASAAATLAPHTLMQRAGLGVARLANAVAPHAQRIWILCGPGNNGGDGLEAAARLLAHGSARGLHVQICLLADESRLPVDASRSLARARQAGAQIHAYLTPPPPLTAHDLVIDALLGRGLTRPVDGVLRDAITSMQQAGAPTLSVDLPSGLPGDTGALTADMPCVQARWTLALLSLPPGLFTAHGRDVAGDVWFDDLGVDAGAAAPDAWLATGLSLSTKASQRLHSHHKGTFGDVWVAGGSSSMRGAAHLAARAALTAGAGRVYLTQPEASYFDATHPELMAANWDDLLSHPARLTHGTVVAGCGGGTAIAQALPVLLTHAARLILDADALNAIANDSSLQAALKARAGRQLGTVLTPHPLEAARLLGCSAADIQGDRLGHARQLADAYAAIVVLKGSGTVIARAGHTPWVLPVGNAALATPGSGDVLAGWLGGLWSQGAAHAHAVEAPWFAARLAAWQHGRAAEAAHPDGRPLPAAQLVGALMTLGASRG